MNYIIEGIKMDKTRKKLIDEAISIILPEYTQFCGHSIGKGSCRNEAIQDVVERLNLYQEKAQFQDGYEIIYVKKD